jgi:predicted dehydrogenase
MSSQEKSRKLRIGIVGCGGISRAHVRGYQAAGGARIAAVCDVNRSSAEKLAAELEVDVAGSAEELANSGAIDAVSICTPPGTHLESCLPFLQAGVPTLCEKPIEITLERALHLDAVIRQRKTPFMIAFCHRFHPAVREAKRLLTAERDLVGEPIFFRNLFASKVDILAGHRSNPALSGGGALIDNCSHALDLFRFLIGDISSIYAQASNLVQPGPVEDFASIEVCGKSSAGQIVSSYSLPVAYNSIEIHCSNSLITINYWVQGRPDLALHLQGEKEQAVTVDTTPDRFSAEIKHFLHCVRSGESPSPGIEDAILNARLIEAAYHSSTKNCKVPMATTS